MTEETKVKKFVLSLEQLLSPRGKTQQATTCKKKGEEVTKRGRWDEHSLSLTTKSLTGVGVAPKTKRKCCG